MSSLRVAIVVQRYGPNVHGGAESAARWLAETLAAQKKDEVHVLTSCADDYTTWKNVYPTGHSLLNGVHVYRFVVDAPRDWRRSQEETGRFLLEAHTVEEEMDWIRREGPFCSELLRYVVRNAAQYDAFIFFTYLYATTFFTLPLVLEKSILVPAAHDEPFLYLDAYRALLQLPRHIVYLTAAERDLVQRVSKNEHIPSTVTAVGMSPPSDPDARRFRARFGLDDDFLLYGGRIDEAKNVPQLLTYFSRYRNRVRYEKEYEHGPESLKLVLMGRPHMPLPDDPHVVCIGFVSDEEKFDALSAASVVVLPSHFESLSIMILESWLVETPVLVNGRSDVLRQQARRSNGGLYYTSYDEFAAGLDTLLASAELRRRLGRQGREFVLEHYNGSQIVGQYRSVISAVRNDSLEVS